MKYAKKNFIDLSLIFLLAIFNLFVLLFPEEILKASRDSIILWARNIIPALLPFVICTNILSELGFINLISNLLESFMYPVFGVPGNGSFALISGMISGYPVGAKITQNLYMSKRITELQAQRLISFVNNAGPLFILGTVGTAMLNNSCAGYFLILVHDLAAIITGLIFRFYKFKTEKYFCVKENFLYKLKKNIRPINIKNIGKIFATSISDGINMILQIGGFILFFAIYIKIIELSNILSLVWKLISKIKFINLLGYESFAGIIIGLIEITNGAKIITQQGCSQKSLVILSMLIAFGGLCVHMQVLSIINKLSLKIYFIAKLIHAVISGFIALLFFKLFDFNLSTNSVFAYQDKNFIEKSLFSLENLLFVILIQVSLVLFILCLRFFYKKKYKK